MGENARLAFEAKFSAAVNYDQLIEAYELAMKRRASRG
jgi:hypothetical protein